MSVDVVILVARRCLQQWGEPKNSLVSLARCQAMSSLVCSPFSPSCSESVNKQTAKGACSVSIEFN